MDQGTSSASSFGNLGEVFHKESSKENKRTKALSLKDKSFRLQHHESKRNSEMAETQKSVAERAQLRLNARKNAEIDDYLIGLLMEGIIDEAYWKFHTKCIYTLSHERYNQIVVEARSGNNPKHLLAFKLKGALELHFKKQVWRDQYKLER